MPDQREDTDVTLRGVRALQFHPRAAYNATPIDSDEEIERRKGRWVPPIKDTSRFKGGSASRHKAPSSYKDPPATEFPVGCNDGYIGEGDDVW